MYITATSLFCEKKSGLIFQEASWIFQTEGANSFKILMREEAVLLKY